jgi:hypothetical protein
MISIEGRDQVNPNEDQVMTLEDASVRGRRLSRMIDGIDRRRDAW